MDNLDSLNEFVDDDEFWQQPIFQRLKWLIDQEENREKTLVINPERFANVVKAKNLLEEIAAEEGMEFEISVDVDNLFRDISLVVLAENLAVKLAKNDFMRVVQLSDAFETVSKLNNKLQIRFNFNHVLEEVR